MGVQPSVRQIGKYVVIDVIGAGGMGIVYRANDPAIGRTVAIKMLKQTEADDHGLLERFFSREMRSTASLNHKNIVTVYDSGDQDGTPYLVMEYLEGEPASKIISERRPLSLVEKLDLVIQVCDGLQYAHDRELIHRDIKPANVIRLSDGTVKIVDFGVSRILGTETSLVQTGQLVGSLSYMSPEQINSGPIDGRSDIFSTGVMLYELLTYVLPFKAADPGATFVKILREEPAPLSTYIRDLPSAMQGVMNRALAKKATDRYQSAEELGFELLQVQKELKDIMISDCMKRADACLQRGDLERARLHLQEITRLDRQHERANRLLRDVRKAIQQQQRSSQVIQMRSQAQVALAGNQYEEAMACADQALRLDPADQESIQLCAEIRIAISRAKAVREALNRAETATFAGDFDEAKEAIEESLRLAPNDSEARALALLVNKELAERSRRFQVQEFVDSARRGIAERKFNDAIDALHRAEELDPSDSNVRELLQWAERGQEQEKRRKDLEEITEQIDKALHAGDYSSAYTISDVGLLRFPEEPTLLRLRTISEKQRDIAERRSFVHDQSLAVKVLSDEGRFSEAVDLLTDALQKYPGEPNLESLLALTRTEIERQERLREESLRQEAMQRAEAEARAAFRQQILTWAVELRGSLDARAELDEIMTNSLRLRSAVAESHVEDDHAKEVARLVLQEVDARIHARDQVVGELKQLRHVIADPQNTASIAEADNRLLSIKAAYPNETNIRQTCEELAGVLRNIQQQRDQTIQALTSLAQDLDKKPTGQLYSLFQAAKSRAGSFAADPRIGALLQQIEYDVTRRLQHREELMRDLNALSADLASAHSLADLARIRERGRAIAAMDQTDEGLTARFNELDAEGERRQAVLAGLLSQLQKVAEAVARAATVNEAETLVAPAAALEEQHPDFQDLQEAVKRIRAEVQGRRMEHGLIVQELESMRSAISSLSSSEELTAVRARATECRGLHPVDPQVIQLCDAIEAEVDKSLRALEELQLRKLACDRAIEVAGQLLRDQQAEEALATLLKVEPVNPDREDLRHQISIAREKLNQLQLERQRAEEARIRQEGIAQEISVARGLSAGGRLDESLKVLRVARQRYPDGPELVLAIESIEQEIGQELERARAEQERAEQLRLEKERAEQERAEQLRLEKERAEQERAELLRLEKERAEQERAEQLRLEKERAEQVKAEELRLEKERAEKAKQEQLRLEKERAEQAKQEQLRLEKERAEQERAEQLRLEKERAEKAKAEQLRLEKERAEKAKAEQLRLEKERAEQAKAEQLRLEKERAEKARAEQLRLEKERAEKAQARARQAKAAQAEKAAARLAAQHQAQIDKAPLRSPETNLDRRRQPLVAILGILIVAVLLAITLTVRFARNRPTAVAPATPTASPQVLPPAPNPPVTVQGPSGSLAIVAAALEGASVSLDGHPQGNISSHRLDLAGLSSGSHAVTIKANRRELTLLVNITDLGHLEVMNARGMDDQLIVALTRSGDHQLIFCRCAGSELRLDGKLLRANGQDRYQVRDRGRSTQDLTLTVRGEKRQISFKPADATHGMIFIENATPGNASPTANVESAKVGQALAGAPQKSDQAAPNPPAQSIAPPPSVPPPALAPAETAKVEDPSVAAWSSIQGTNDVSVLRAFRDKYPSSPLAKSAAVRMDALSWASAKASSQPADVERFLKDYPDSPHVLEARSRLASLNNGIEENNQQQGLQRDREQVLQALDAYKRAYEAKDVNALAAAWPGAPKQKLQDTFKVVGKLNMSLQPEVPAINGDNATVKGIQRIEIESQGSKSSNRTAIVFALKRVQGKWVIDNLK